MVINMDKEVLFARTLEKVRSKAREQGNCISREQVEAEFDALDLNEGQLQMVFDYLAGQKIGIGEPVDLDSFLSEEEKNYLQGYFETIEALPAYSQGEIEAFTVAAMAGESQAQQRLVEVYLRDVVDIAKLYAGQGVLLEDLIGEGNVALTLGVGLLGSLEKPSEAGGMLVRMMMNAMEEYIQENAAGEQVGNRVAERVNRVADKARELAEELHRKVTPEELARHKGLSLKAIQDACRMSGFQIEDIEYAEDSLRGF